MGGGPPAGSQRVDVPDDNSVLPMPTNLRTAAVARWVGRGNGPSRVTGASACPAAGDCYKNNYPHNSRCSEDKHCTAGISHSTTNGATAHFPCQIRISSAKGGPGRDRMRKPSVTDAFRFTHGQTNSCTESDVADMAVYGTLTFRPSYGRKVQEGEAVSVGRRQSAQTYWQQDDAQVATGPHNQLPLRIWRAAEALPSRQWSFSWVFFIDWSPPQRTKHHRHDLHAYLPEAQPRTQRIRHWHWSRGTVRTTYRHSFALHASLPGNHGYAAVRQGWGTTAHRWNAAELLVRGSVLYGMTHQAWTRNTRTGFSQQQCSLSSVGCHARKPSRL